MYPPSCLKVKWSVHKHRLAAGYNTHKTQVHFICEFGVSMEKKFGFMRFVPTKQVFEHLLMALQILDGLLIRSN